MKIIQNIKKINILLLGTRKNSGPTSPAARPGP